MFFLYTITIFAYVLIRGIIPLDSNLLCKALLTILILTGTQLHYISKKTTGLMVGEYPKPILYIWEYLFSLSVISFLIILFSDTLKIITEITGLKSLNTILISSDFLIGSWIVAAVMSLFGLYQGTRIPNVINKTIYIDNWPKNMNGFIICQLTDLHISSLLSKKWLEKVVNKTNELSADLIVITGDFTDGYPSKHSNSISPLAKLKANHGVFGVTGNHDYYYDFKGWLNEYQTNGITFLFNEHIKIQKNNDYFFLAGVPDSAAAIIKEEMPDIKKALYNITGKAPIILLDHRPSNAFKNAENGVDLQLSGHTHGGMIPLLANIVKRMNNGFYSGYYLVGNMQLYLSNGTGIWNGFPIRIGYHSEITKLTIFRKD